MVIRASVFPLQATLLNKGDAFPVTKAAKLVQAFMIIIVNHAMEPKFFQLAQPPLEFQLVFVQKELTQAIFPASVCLVHLLVKPAQALSPPIVSLVKPLPALTQ